MRLLLATTNNGKLKEIRAALAELNLQFESLLERSDLPAIEESGGSFAENARLKAEYYHRLTGVPTLADDSGLMVDALQGAPGVYSARFASTDQKRIEKLLDQLLHLNPPTARRYGRKARFVCAICFYRPQRVIEVKGDVSGEIAQAPRGNEGFGYDPIFYYPALARTFGELTAAEKNQVSHRAVALQKLRDELAAEH